MYEGKKQPAQADEEKLLIERLFSFIFEFCIMYNSISMS